MWRMLSFHKGCYRVSREHLLPNKRWWRELKMDVNRVMPWLPSWRNNHECLPLQLRHYLPQFLRMILTSSGSTHLQHNFESSLAPPEISKYKYYAQNLIVVIAHYTLTPHKPHPSLHTHLTQFTHWINFCKCWKHFHAVGVPGWPQVLQSFCQTGTGKQGCRRNAGGREIVICIHETNILDKWSWT